MATPSDRDEPDALPVFDYVKKKVKQVLKIQDIEEDDDATQDNQVQLVKVKKTEKKFETKARMTRKQLLSDIYKMDYPRRGKAVIFNNKVFAPHLVRQGYTDRKGTDVDSSRICKRLQLLGFEVDKRQDATAQEMMKILDQYANEDHSDADCFVCVLLSHGEPDVIFGHNGKVELVDIFQKFDGNHCPTLIGKPKLFIIQACRGRQFDIGEDIVVARDVIDAKLEDETDIIMDETIRIPNEADFLIAQSTVPGFYSWRNSLNGSWFMQALADALDKYGATVDFLKLLTYVNRKVALDFESNTSQPFTNRMKQVPAFTTRLTKDLYFQPKS